MYMQALVRTIHIATGQFLEVLFFRYCLNINKAGAQFWSIGSVGSTRLDEHT